MFTSLPGGVRRVADGEQRRELLDEGVALQLALVVLRALQTKKFTQPYDRTFWEEIFVDD